MKDKDLTTSKTEGLEHAQYVVSKRKGQNLNTSRQREMSEKEQRCQTTIMLVATSFGRIRQR